MMHREEITGYEDYTDGALADKVRDVANNSPFSRDRHFWTEVAFRLRERYQDKGSEDVAVGPTIADAPYPHTAPASRLTNSGLADTLRAMAVAAPDWMQSHACGHSKWSDMLFTAADRIPVGEDAKGCPDIDLSERQPSRVEKMPSFTEVGPQGVSIIGGKEVIVGDGQIIVRTR